MDIETLAMLLHEAGREAVEQGATVAAEKLGDESRTFIEWGALSETAREGRRIQARYLIAHGIGFVGTGVAGAGVPASPPPQTDVSGRHIN